MKQITKQEQERILEKLYLSPSDISQLLNVGMNRAVDISKEMCKKMEDKKIYDPSKPTNWDGISRRRYLVNTELFRKELKI